MIIRIKNMVCPRCIKAVESLFLAAGIKPVKVELGSVVVEQELNGKESTLISKALEQEGFEWLSDHKAKLAEQIKQLIIGLVHYGQLDELQQNLSTWLSLKMHKDYHYLSNLFSSIENNTIEQYFILQKIEKVKEWLVYGEYTLGEMAYKLGYSSTAHLSGQFKKVTGFSPTQFRQLKEHHRKSIDQL